MAKIVDVNSFWFVKHNPLSKVGVFPYLGSTISDECEPDKVYNVFRPAETLRDSVDSWNTPPKPLLEGHQMVGDGFDAIDSRPIQGVVSNVSFDENDGVLYGDISVYSESLKDSIATGINQLSLGYLCKYEKRTGVYKGQAYDYIQVDMRGNHVAVVPAGRAGPDVRVYDEKDIKYTMDLLDCNIDNFKESEQPIEKGVFDMVDKRKIVREIMAIAAKPNSDFEGGESEKIDTIAKLLEDSEYAKSERGTADEDEAEEKKATDKCGKDEDPAEKEEKKSEDEDEEKKSEDSLDPAEVMAFLRSIVERLDMVLNKKAVADEDDGAEEKKSEDEDEDKDSKAEDEDEEKADEKKSAEDSAVFVLGNNTALDAADDAALRDYLK